MKNIKNEMLLVMTAMIWGLAFVAQRVGAEYVGPFTFNGIRFTLGALSLIPVIIAFEKRDPEAQVHNPQMKLSCMSGVLAGVVLFTASTLQQYGINMTQSAGKAGFITGLYTVLVPVIGIFLRKKTHCIIWIGVAFAVVGLFLLSVNEKWEVSMGDVVLMIGSVFWAIHILIVDRFISSVYPIRFSCVQFATSAVLGLLAAFMFETMTFEGIKGALIPILYGGIFSAGIAYTCQALGQKNAEPTRAAIILSTESVFSAIGGAVILGEVMSGRGYVGCALIFSGIIISQLAPKKQV